MDRGGSDRVASVLGVRSTAGERRRGQQGTRESPAQREGDDTPSHPSITLHVAVYSPPARLNRSGCDGLTGSDYHQGGPLANEPDDP